MRGRDLGEAKEGTGGGVGVFESFVKTMEGSSPTKIRYRICEASAGKVSRGSVLPLAWQH